MCQNEGMGDGWNYALLPVSDVFENKPRSQYATKNRIGIKWPEIHATAKKVI